MFMKENESGTHIHIDVKFYKFKRLLKIKYLTFFLQIISLNKYLLKRKFQAILFYTQKLTGGSF